MLIWGGIKVFQFTSENSLAKSGTGFRLKIFDQDNKEDIWSNLSRVSSFFVTSRAESVLADELHADQRDCRCPSQKEHQIERHQKNEMLITFFLLFSASFLRIKWEDISRLSIPFLCLQKLRNTSPTLRKGKSLTTDLTLYGRL